MRSYLLILSSIVLVAIFIGCKDTFEDLFSKKNELTIYVYDIDAWTPDSPWGEDVEGAEVKLLDVDNPQKNSPLYEKISEWDGDIESDAKVKFEDIPDGEYILYVSKGNKSNILEKEIIDGEEVGFVITGIYNTEEEAVSSGKEGAYVGGPVLLDINGDGKYDKYDKQTGEKIEVNKHDEYNIFIAKDI